jgi:hypothetical protein
LGKKQDPISKKQSNRLREWLKRQSICPASVKPQVQNSLPSKTKVGGLTLTYFKIQ